MPLLTREIGQSVVFDESIALTVAVVGSDFVDIQISEFEGRKRLVTLVPQERVQITVDLLIVFISRQGDKVWLGFDFPKQTQVRRTVDDESPWQATVNVEI